MTHYDSEGVDVFKTLDWQSAGTDEEGIVPPPWTRLRLERELYCSVRLEQLFKRAKVRSQLTRGIRFDDLKASAEDELWIEGRLGLLAKPGWVDAPKTRVKSSATQKWFKRFLQQN